MIVNGLIIVKTIKYCKAPFLIIRYSELTRGRYDGVKYWVCGRPCPLYLQEELEKYKPLLDHSFHAYDCRHYINKTKEACENLGLIWVGYRNSMVDYISPQGYPYYQHNKFVTFNFERKK